MFWYQVSSSSESYVATPRVQKIKHAGSPSTQYAESISGVPLFTTELWKRTSIRKCFQYHCNGLICHLAQLAIGQYGNLAFNPSARQGVLPTVQRNSQNTWVCLVPRSTAHLRAIADREANISVQLLDFAAPVFELAHPTCAGHQRDKGSAAKNVTTALRNSSGFWI